MKKLIAPFLAALLLILTVSGCASSSSASDSAMSMTGAAAPAADYSKGSEEGLNYGESETQSVTASDSDSGSTSVTSEEVSQKLIYTASLNIETLDYDTSISDIETLVAQFKGYIQSASVGDSRVFDSEAELRHAEYVLRIPSDSLDSFITSCGDIGNVYSSSKSTQNATEEYIDLEARLKSYKLEIESLEAILAKADTLDTVVALQSRLSEIRAQVESIESRMRNIDSLVTYSTVNIGLDEVVEINETTEVPKTFGERLSSELKASADGFKDEMESIGIFVAADLPFWLLLFIIKVGPFILIVLAAYFIVKRIKRKKKVSLGSSTASESNEQNKE